MKRLFFIIIGLAGVLSACSDGENSSLKAPSVVIIAPMTGPAAVYGEWLQHGVEFAIENGVSNIRFAYYDSAADPKTAVTLANKAITQKDTIAIWTVTSADTMAVRDVASNSEFTLVTSTATSPAITDGRKGILRTIVNSRQETEVLVRYVTSKLSPKKVAIFYINDAGGKASLEEFRFFLSGAGVAVVAEEPFDKSPQELRTVTAKVLATRPDAVVVTGYTAAMGAVVSNIRTQDKRIPILCNTGFDNPENLSLPAEVLTNIYFSIASVDQKSIGTSFINAFKNRFRAGPNIYEITAYDTARLLSEAVAGGARKVTLDSALKRQPFNGQNGIYRFTDKGNVLKEVVINKIDYGRITQDAKYLPTKE